MGTAVRSIAKSCTRSSGLECGKTIKRLHPPVAAARAARWGIETLVMSTDAAHSLGDALDVDLTAWAGGLREESESSAEPWRWSAGYAAMQINAPHSLGSSWRVVQDTSSRCWPPWASTPSWRRS